MPKQSLHLLPIPERAHGSPWLMLSTGAGNQAHRRGSSLEGPSGAGPLPAPGNRMGGRGGHPDLHLRCQSCQHTSLPLAVFLGCCPSYSTLAKDLAVPSSMWSADTLMQEVRTPHLHLLLLVFAAWLAAGGHDQPVRGATAGLPGRAQCSVAAPAGHHRHHWSIAGGRSCSTPSHSCRHAGELIELALAHGPKSSLAPDLLPYCWSWSCRRMWLTVLLCLHRLCSCGGRP